MLFNPEITIVKALLTTSRLLETFATLQSLEFHRIQSMSKDIPYGYKEGITLPRRHNYRYYSVFTIRWHMTHIFSCDEEGHFTSWLE